MEQNVANMEPAFWVNFKCRNCGHSWQIPYGTKMEVMEDWQGVYTHDYTRGFGLAGSIARVDCPRCKLSDHVRVDKRSPMRNHDVLG